MGIGFRKGKNNEKNSTEGIEKKFLLLKFVEWTTDCFLRIPRGRNYSGVLQIATRLRQVGVARNDSTLFVIANRDGRSGEAIC